MGLQNRRKLDLSIMCEYEYIRFLKYSENFTPALIL